MAGVNEGSHRKLSDPSLIRAIRVGDMQKHATHTFIHKWSEPYLPLLPSRRALPHFGWYSFSVPLSVEG